MTDLESVIRGLEEFKADLKPFAVNRADWQKVDNALELLKAQEPRVMDADEIVLSAEPSKWLWVERRGDYCAEAYKAGKTVRGLIAFDCETPCAFLYCEYQRNGTAYNASGFSFFPAPPSPMCFFSQRFSSHKTREGRLCRMVCGQP